MSTHTRTLPEEETRGYSSEKDFYSDLKVVLEKDYGQELSEIEVKEVGEGFANFLTSISM